MARISATLGPRWVAAFFLLLLAVSLVLTAIQERDLGATLDSLSRPPAMAAPGAQYESAAWLHLVAAVIQAGIALGILRSTHRIWFALGALSSAFAVASGVWMLWPVAPPAAPVHLGALLPIASLVAGSGALLSSVVGWLMSPPLPPLRPSVPIAPSNHQA